MKVTIEVDNLKDLDYIRARLYEKKQQDAMQAIITEATLRKYSF